LVHRDNVNHLHLVKINCGRKIKINIWNLIFLFLNKWSYLFSQSWTSQVISYGIVWNFYRKGIEGIYIVIIYYKQHFPFFWLLLNKIYQQYAELQGKCCNRRQTQNVCKIEGKKHCICRITSLSLKTTKKEERKKSDFAYIPASVMFSHNTKHSQRIYKCCFLLRTKDAHSFGKANLCNVSSPFWYLDRFILIVFCYLSLPKVNLLWNKRSSFLGLLLPFVSF